jgi:hypothetical protein
MRSPSILTVGPQREPIIAGAVPRWPAAVLRRHPARFQSGHRVGRSNACAWRGTIDVSRALENTSASSPLCGRSPASPPCDGWDERSSRLSRCHRHTITVTSTEMTAFRVPCVRCTARGTGTATDETLGASSAVQTWSRNGRTEYVLVRVASRRAAPQFGKRSARTFENDIRNFRHQRRGRDVGHPSPAACRPYLCGCRASPPSGTSTVSRTVWQNSAPHRA